jgi:hypothetical protein
VAPEPQLTHDSPNRLRIVEISTKSSHVRAVAIVSHLKSASTCGSANRRYSDQSGHINPVKSMPFPWLKARPFGRRWYG